MTTATLVWTGFALAMDAFAVCISSSIAHPTIPWRRMLRLPVVFALFQAGMPALGFAGACAFRGVIEAWDHWIAFGLLAAVGGHMLHEARGGDTAGTRPDPLRLSVLLALAVATSIDALAAGVGLAVLDVSLADACVAIGLATFGACVPGVLLGRRLGARLAQRAEIAGGLLLIALGVKILVEHLAP